MLSVTVSDSQEQTRAVSGPWQLAAHGPIFSRWQAHQKWLAASPWEVVIPYAADLAEMVPPVANSAAARLHDAAHPNPRAHLAASASRRKDGDGQLIAEIADYAAVRELVADLVAESAEVAIKPEVRGTVAAVAELLADGKKEVRQEDIKNVLKLDKSVVSRRVAAAMQAGVLRNLEDRKGRPARLVLGDPLPEEIEILPRPERLHGCTGAEGESARPLR